MGGGAARAKPKPVPKPRILQRPRPDNLPSDTAAAGATPGSVVCDKCSEEFTKPNLNQDHPMCRGHDPANRTCKYCNQILGSLMARKNHERYTHSEAALADGLISAIAKKRQETRWLMSPFLIPLCFVFVLVLAGLSGETGQPLRYISTFPSFALAMTKFNGFACLCLTAFVLASPWRTPH